MVDYAPGEDRQAELEALIRSQDHDRHSRHVRRQSSNVQTATDLRLDFDRLPNRPGALILREGRAHEWDQRYNGGTCPTCHGHPGSDYCLRCEGGLEGRHLRGKETPDIGGPTVHTPPPAGLKGGVGR